MEIFTSSHFFSPRNALRQFLIILFFAVYFWASSMEKILIILACLALNAVLAATEMAFVTVGKHRLRDLARSGNNEAKRILTLRDKPERTLSVIQIGITLVASIAAATGGAGAVDTVAPFLDRQYQLSAATAEVLAVLLVVLPITYLNVVLGELVPKTLALRDPERIALRTSYWLSLVDYILSPLVTTFEKSTKWFLKVYFNRPMKKELEVPEQTVDLRELTQQTRQYVVNLVSVERKRVKDVLMPWNCVIHVEIKQLADEVEGIVISSGHTRLPVMNGVQVVGLVNTKEFMALRSSGREDWISVIRPIVVLQEAENIFTALRKMQERRSHLSVVMKEQTAVGIVTMEDILEEVIGDVFDEDDDGAVRRILSASARFRPVTRKTG